MTLTCVSAISLTGITWCPCIYTSLLTLSWLAQCAVVFCVWSFLVGHVLKKSIPCSLCFAEVNAWQFFCLFVFTLFCFVNSHFVHKQSIRFGSCLLPWSIIPHCGLPLPVFFLFVWLFLYFLTKEHFKNMILVKKAGSDTPQNSTKERILFFQT